MDVVYRYLNTLVARFATEPRKDDDA
jgi:hypothetical protein